MHARPIDFEAKAASLVRGSMKIRGAADLVRTLIEARDAKELTRYMRRLERIELVILDEVGFVPFDRHGGELLFNVLAARHGRRSVLITTNLSFAEWPRVFGGDEKLTNALLDRLAEHATVITTKGKSYRMRTRKTTTMQPSTEPAPVQPADAPSDARSKESRKG